MNQNVFSNKSSGLSDGVSGNRHHGLDPYKFAHTLISSCLEETDRIIGPSSMRGLVHRAGNFAAVCAHGMRDG